MVPEQTYFFERLFIWNPLLKKICSFMSPYLLWVIPQIKIIENENYTSCEPFSNNAYCALFYAIKTFSIPVLYIYILNTYSELTMFFR